MTGMAATPVIETTLSALFGVAAAAVAVMMGFSPSKSEGEAGATVTDSPKRVRLSKTSPWPLTILTLGVAIGASLGVTMRSNEVLLPNAKRFANRWKATGYSEEQLYRILFRELHGVDSSENKGEKPLVAPVLFSVTMDDAEFVRGRKGSELKKRLEASPNPAIAAAAMAAENDDQREGIVKLICELAKYSK